MSTVRYFEATIRDVEAIGRFNAIAEPDLYRHEYWTHLPDRSFLMVAADQNTVIGTQALIAYHMNINGKRILAGRSERTLVAPAYRGCGIWDRLVEICLERGEKSGHEFFWGANTSAVKAFKKAGFIHIHGHRQYLLSSVSLSRVLKCIFSSRRQVSLNPVTAYRAVRSGNLRQGLEYMRILSSVFSLVYRSVKGFPKGRDRRDRFEIMNAPSDYDDIDALYNEIRGDRDDLLRLHQDKEFCDWIFRLGRNEVARWFAYENGRLRAYLYATLSGSLGRVLDFAAADEEAFHCLLTHFHRACMEGGQVFLQAVVNPLCPHQKLSVACLKRNGFLPVYTGGNSVIKPGRYNDVNVLGNPRCLYFTDLWSLLYNTGQENRGTLEHA